MRTASAVGAALQQIAQAGMMRPEGSGVSENIVREVGQQYLVFTLDNRDVAIKAEQVQGVERLADVTIVPNVISWVKGVMNLRGSIASVVDLRMFLELEQVPYTPKTRLLSLQYNEMVICFVVDGVSHDQCRKYAPGNNSPLGCTVCCRYCVSGHPSDCAPGCTSSSFLRKNAAL
jgi:hypothetical protein